MQKEGKGIHIVHTDREKPMSKSQVCGGWKGNYKYTDTLPGASLKFPLHPWGTAVLRPALFLPGARSPCSWRCHPLTCCGHWRESQLCSAAGVSSMSVVGLWEQTPFAAFWEEPWNPAHSGYCKTAPETLLVMGSHQGKERLTQSGLCWALLAVWVRVFLDKGSPPGEVLDEIWGPTLQGWIFLAWMQMEREDLGQQGRGFLKSSLVSPSFLKACFLGRPGLASHQHFNSCTHSHSGHSFYSRKCGVPHNSGLPASSCATSCSSNRGNQSHPPTKRRSTS